ncbi:MAG: hypothetical protein WA139_02845 [Candidatus Aenigmatarchaeota archaeon]
MDKNELKNLMKELYDIKCLLILNASKAGTTSEDIGKCIGIGSSTVRKILAGL